MNGPISCTCALSVGWSLARESSFNLVHLHRCLLSHSEIISPSLSLFHSPCSLSLSLSLSFPNGRVIRLAPVRWEDEEAVHTPQSWSLSLSLSSIESLLYFPLGMIAHVGRPTRVRKESVRDGRRGNGERVGDTEDGGDILCLVKWASPRTKTNPALPSSRPGIDSGCEAARAHKHAGTRHGWMSICDSLSQTTNALFSHAEEVAAAAFLFLPPPAPDNRRSRAFPPLGRPCSLCGVSRRGSS